MPAAGPSDDRGPLFLLLALGGVLFFLNLAGTDLGNPDEPRYAQVAREMVRSGQWVVPHLDAQVYDQKPPLFFWLIGGFGIVIGAVNEWAARLPSAVSSTLVLLFTYLFGARLFGRRAGLLAGLVLATSALFVIMARKASISAWLVALAKASVRVA